MNTILEKRAVSFLVIITVLSSHFGALNAQPTLYIHDSSRQLATVDVPTGNVSIIGPLDAVFTDIAFDPSGQLFGITFNELYEINATDASVALVGTHGIPSAVALTFNSDGTLYAASGSNTNLYTINPNDGTSVAIGSTGHRAAGDLAFNSGIPVSYTHLTLPTKA